jgi:hypothetical protein
LLTLTRERRYSYYRTDRKALSEVELTIAKLQKGPLEV